MIYDILTRGCNSQFFQTYHSADPENTGREHAPIFRNRQHGLLRSKVENGGDI